ncbi:hypothetical protein vBBak6_116 [Bacillus phage v_B-Bak6]|uniref:Uncharacterized protein n=1 Tax=Bacillus phage v_B-Bak10 TaxID=2094736 RepID=A0A385IJZ1_9CAUD|nr:hypothetical protein PP654_gp033 [Bacillus phage v_B-Bak10]AXY83076.1 hypothetical protein vBBak1_116 [Bacillus phage v_B-Bak1]AXY83196.1 hypothetical protein vBBak6_116 [Bacillus phage v_B-Bak6]AXY83224.1 hypothetical protein vBBBak10_109 [Bacillus phage v_B-Bak10]
MKEFEKDVRRNATEIEGFSDADWLEACEEADLKEIKSTRKFIVDEVTIFEEKEVTIFTVLELFDNGTCNELSEWDTKEEAQKEAEKIALSCKGIVVTEEQADKMNNGNKFEGVTNKIEKVENNMDYIKCSEKELTAIEKVMEGLQEFVNVTTSESDLSYDIQMTNDHKLDNLIYDIKNNELFKNWLIFKEGVTKVTAYDTSGTGAEIIDILHNNYDKVFGRYEEGGEHIYFISESREIWNEEREEDETIFMVEDTPVSMSDCIRHNV